MTTYYVTRDTARENASDEDRAMAHTTIYRGDDLADAQESLRDALVEEAGYLTRGRDITKPGDLWAFKRATAMVELSTMTADLTPGEQGSPYRVAREVEGLLFTLIAVDR